MVYHFSNESIVNSDDDAAFLRNSCPGAPEHTFAQDVRPGVSAHDIIIWLSIGCSAVTVAAIAFLILRHLLSYTKPREQRYLLRVLALPAIYAIVNLLAVIFYGANIYLEEVPKILEAVAIASLFELFAEHVTPEATSVQRDLFYQELPRQRRTWGTFWQMGPQNLLHNRGSLRWYRITHLLVFQYVPVSVFLGIAKWVVAAVECPHGKTAQTMKLIIDLLGALFISVALYGLIEYERRMKAELAGVGSKRKLWGIKLFVGISVTFNVCFGIAQKFTDLAHAEPRLNYYDITIGVPDVLFEFCMLPFSVFFLWAFYWGPYLRAGPRKSLIKAIWDWVNITDIGRGTALAFAYLVKTPFGTGTRGIGYTVRTEKP